LWRNLEEEKYGENGGLSLKKVKQIGAILLVLSLLLSMTACSGGEDGGDAPPETEITCWVLPVLAGEGVSFLEEALAYFKQQYPSLIVNLMTLDADRWEEQIKGLLGEEVPPDLLLARPEHFDHLQASLADLSDIMEDQLENIPAAILSSTNKGEGYTFYPMAASAYVMAFNQNLLEEADALSLLPAEGNRTWTWDQYIAALEILAENLPNDVDAGIFYYGSTAATVGSVSLIANAFGATYREGSLYKINTSQGVEAIEAVKAAIGDRLLVNGMTVQAQDAIDAFVNGTAAHTILYSMDYDLSHKAVKKNSFTTIFMPYPSVGTPKISYSLLGGGVLDHGDENKVAAAKAFLNFLTTDPDVAGSLAGLTGGFSVNRNNNGFLQDEYTYFAQLPNMLGAYEVDDEESSYKLAWINMLRECLVHGEDPETQLDIFVEGGASVPAGEEFHEADVDD